MQQMSWSYWTLSYKSITPHAIEKIIYPFQKLFKCKTNPVLVHRTFINLIMKVVLVVICFFLQCNAGYGDPNPNWLSLAEAAANKASSDVGPDAVPQRRHSWWHHLPRSRLGRQMTIGLRRSNRVVVLWQSVVVVVVVVVPIVEEIDEENTL